MITLNFMHGSKTHFSNCPIMSLVQPLQCHGSLGYGKQSCRLMHAPLTCLSLIHCWSHVEAFERCKFLMPDSGCSLSCRIRLLLSTSTLQFSYKRPQLSDFWLSPRCHGCLSRIASRFSLIRTPPSSLSTNYNEHPTNQVSSPRKHRSEEGKTSGIPYPLLRIHRSSPSSGNRSQCQPMVGAAVLLLRS